MILPFCSVSIPIRVYPRSSVVKLSFLPFLPFAWFVTTYRASDRLLLGTILLRAKRGTNEMRSHPAGLSAKRKTIVAALGTQFRG